MFTSIKRHFFLLGALIFAVAILFQWSLTSQSNKTKHQQSYTSIGNPATLNLAYSRWKAQNYLDNDAHLIRLPLNYMKHYSTQYTEAMGMGSIDLISGVVDVEITGLTSKEKHEVWLLDGMATKRIYIGQLEHHSNIASLHTRLKASDLAGFSMNQMMVTSGDSSVVDSGKSYQNLNTQGLLFGSPTLFQRLYYEEIRLQTKVFETNQVKKDTKFATVPFSFLIPAPAFAADTPAIILDALIAQGEALFFTETFDGNGRTCGTCHPAENNFTIDPAYIATLPANDPLFIAEFNPKLANLENPTLMRDFGLIRANLDGMDDLENKFVMRSVSHTLGMSMSIQSNATEAPFQMTGWSGDGAPNGGTLRDFSTGAVIQHFPQSLDRNEGEDFRLPTASELDALEAFMLSLGRQSDPDLNSLRLKNRDAERGRVLFLAEDSKNRTVQAAKCNICHRNAGALTVAGFNQNFITGVDNMTHPATLAGETLPKDGGFGVAFNNGNGAFGDSSFNTPSLWEAADTAPYFHHNGAETLEDAIAFYDSAEFKKSVEGQRLLLMDTGGQEMAIETDVLAAFLRVINVLENMRSSSDYMNRATGQSKSNAKKLLVLAKADVVDILAVLKEGELHEDAVPYFKQAKSLIGAAKDKSNLVKRDGLIVQALSKIQTAKLLLVDATPVGDTVKPTVNILTPVANEVISGFNSVQVDAFDDTAIESVILFVGGSEMGRLAAAPFVFSWDTTQFADGLMLVKTVVNDTNGNTTTASVLVEIRNFLIPITGDVINPVVSILTPQQGNILQGSVLITADASDNDALDRVVFMIDQTEIGLVTSAPYEVIWDTVVFSEGFHQISTTAIDSSGNSASHVVGVSVDNIAVVCTVYSCPSPTPPSTEPPPVQTMPVGSSPDGEFDGVVEAKDVTASTVTISTDDGPLTVTITTDTEFMGSIVGHIDDLLIGHIVQGEFFRSSNEIVWIEADMPPGF